MQTNAHNRKGVLIAHDLYRELQGLNQSQEPDSLTPLVAFQRREVQLTENYRYPHPTGERLFGGLRKAVAAHPSRLLKGLEQGTFETWQDIIEQDKAFMMQHQ